MKIVDLDEVIDAIENTDWYHLFNGKLSEGAEGEESALYRAEDVYKAIKGVQHAEAIPIEFIQKRISILHEMAEYDFEETDGYIRESSVAEEELENLLTDWQTEQEKSYFPKGFFSKERPLAKGEEYGTD